ncbi:hypothetical protein EBZ39_02970 [bacterium]|nr:hypothetical protein [bacterium]
MSDRTKQLEAAFIEEGGKVGSLTLRPFSLGTLNLCRRLNLTLFLDGSEEISDDEKQRQIVAFAWFQSQPLKTVLAAIRQGSHEDAIAEFEFGLSVSDLPALLAEIQRIGEMASAAAVEVEAKPGSSVDEGAPKN